MINTDALQTCVEQEISEEHFVLCTTSLFELGLFVESVQQALRHNQMST